MNEEDLKEAFHDVIVRSSPPSPMDPAQALDQGRRIRKRRRVALAGAAVVTLTVGAVAGPTLVANLADNGSAGPMVAGGGTPSLAGPTSAPTVAPTAKSGATVLPSAPTTRKTGDPWPEGQADRTASAGPRAVRVGALMADLSSSVPAGFSTPNLKYPDGRSARWPQAQYASADGEQDYWEYMATIPVQKDDRVGQLLVMSTTPSGKPATTPCKLALTFWGSTGPCTVVDVDGKKVGVVTAKKGSDYDQSAAYRYDDGTVVFIAQAKKTDLPGKSPLNQPVFTTQQLAEQVTSAKFKIST
ncbi:hypothetical protein OHA70_30755 [Kribbella sp. NBC_00382]|uniref:hypothetical protein n=1 Tax=Kribbella sp. NBC_00382 TaxID=2975967 RepID=UPI002E2191E5